MRIFPILLYGLALFAVACSKDETVVEKVIEKEAPTKQETTFVVGDPSQYLFGTQMSNFIPKLVIEDKEFYRIVARTMKDTEVIETNKQRVKNQTPSLAEVSDVDLDYYTSLRLMNSLQDYPAPAEKKRYKFGRKEDSKFQLIFESVNFMDLKLVGYDYDGKYYNLNQEYIHISISPDQTVFSVSYYDNLYRDGSKALTLLIFSMKRELPRRLVSKTKYMYHWGPNVPAGLDASKPLVVNVCGKELFAHKFLIDPMVKQWQDVLVGRLDIKLNYMLAGCPPYTDINSHNIYMIDGIRTLNTTHEGMGGVTTSVIADTKLDSDIFMYKHELLKATDNFEEQEYYEYFKSLFLHEFGHFLGLAHQFDGVTQSVMAYQKHSTLKPYDIEAIQALYPLQIIPQ